MVAVLSFLKNRLIGLFWMTILFGQFTNVNAVYGIEGQNGCDCPEDSVAVLVEGNPCVCLPNSAPEAISANWKQPRMDDLKNAHNIFAKWREFYGGVHKVDDPSPDGYEPNPTKDLVILRWGQFQRKLKHVAAHNTRFDEGDEEFSVALNGMADLRDEERTHFYLGARPIGPVPDDVDGLDGQNARRRRGTQKMVGYPALTEAELEMTPDQFLKNYINRRRTSQAGEIARDDLDGVEKHLREVYQRREEEAELRRRLEGSDEKVTANLIKAVDWGIHHNTFFLNHGQWIKEYTKERNEMEFRTVTAGSSVNTMARWKFPVRADLLPASPRTRVSWINYDTPVRQQRDCGSCWAHAALAGLENHLKRKNWPNTHLSVQELVDCGSTMDSCELGWYEYQGMEYASVFGVTSERTYPYENRNSICRRDGKHRHIPPNTFEHVQMPSGEWNMARTLSLGAVVMRMWIPYDFMDYRGGVYNKYNCNGSTTSGAHAMVFVGYTENYWIVKNSWGTDWG